MACELLCILESVGQFTGHAWEGGVLALSGGLGGERGMGLEDWFGEVGEAVL